MKVLVSGSHGQLAHAIQRFWTGHELVLPEESLFNLADRAAIRKVVRDVRPDYVINAGAFTRVDDCESHPEQARLVNGVAVGWLAEACSEIGACLVQISTDYVFDGTTRQPYVEDDPVCPISVYGRSKVLGEREARTLPDHLIVRTAWLYDGWGQNFYTTMLRMAKERRPIKVVDDQRGAPTSCRALARQLQVAVEAGWRGTLHATCDGEATWYTFARELFRLHDLQVDLSPCGTDEYPRPAKRPAYSVLSSVRRKESGVDVMPSWQRALAEVVESPSDARIGEDHA